MAQQSSNQVARRGRRRLIERAPVSLGGPFLRGPRLEDHSHRRRHAQDRDNQLEMVFSNGKAIIPPMIDERARVWALVNSMPVEVRDDGQVRAAPGSSAAPSFDDIVKTMAEMKAQHDRTK